MSREVALKTSGKADKSKSTEAWEAVHRVVFPESVRSDTISLYLDGGQPRKQVRSLPAQIEGRHSLRVLRKSAVSLATYFNAFPAAYWQRYTEVTKVRFLVEAKGKGTIHLYRSNAAGAFVELETAKVDSDTEQTVQFETGLDKFIDGGWLWADYSSDDADLVVSNGRWCVPTDVKVATKLTKLTIAMTTFNLGSECVKQMNLLASAPDVLERVASIQIADQGTKRVADTPGYDEAAAKLGDRFRVIVQPNLGGSGGFSRGMYESLKNPESDAVLLLDDDARAEPESILRAIQFSDYTVKPTIVGGHMFNMYEPTKIHSLGEVMDMNSMWWHAVDPELAGVDFARNSIRTKRGLNVRLDVAYNGWWMCLIPNRIIEEIGLSLPVFIKWDDAEYGIRAREHGFPTVSLPGVAAWHVPWVEKDDDRDWQAYFHMKNRWILALLHSPFKNGGKLQRESIKLDIAYLMSMRYMVEDLRIQALRDLLRGPDYLHPSMEQSAANARKVMANEKDSELVKDLSGIELPTVMATPSTYKIPNRKRHKRNLIALVKGAVHQFKKEDPATRNAPQVWFSKASSRIWFMANYDCALESSATGAGAWLMRRNRDRAFEQFNELMSLYRELFRRWPELSKAYRDKLSQITSPEDWEKTFGIADKQDQ